MYILNNNDRIIFGNNFCRQFTGNNLTKNTICSHGNLLILCNQKMVPGVGLEPT